MEFWTYLGIEKTKDVDSINEAYHKKLPLVNPEDKPEEFKALRSEYEEALKYAKEQEEPEKDESELTPVERWKVKLDELYTHIADRCDASKWNELLSDPVFDSLDSRADALEELLVYLMDHWRLPREIWQLLNDAFDLRERREELIEKFPSEFIDNAVIGGIENESSVPYDMFIPQNTGDIDPFFQLYFKARDEILSNDLDNAKATLDDLDATGIIHPFGELLHIRYDFMRAEGTAAPDDVTERAKSLYEKYPDNTEISGFYADMLSTRGENEAAIEIYDKILSAEPNNNNMRYHKAQSLMELGEYKEAKELFIELNEAIPYNISIRNGMNEANKKVIEQYAVKLEENHDDFEVRYEYAWSLFLNNEEKKAQEVMDIPAPEDISERCDYENIHTKLCQSLGDYEGCLRHAKSWREYVDKLPEGQTDKEKRRKNKLGDIALMECIALYDLKRYDEALKKSDEALAADPDEYRVYQERYLIFTALHNYDEAVKVCEHMVKMKPSYVSYHMLGRAHYLRGNMQEAFDSFGQAIEYEKDAGSYIYRARILLAYDEYDDAKEIIDLLRENEINTDGVKYCESLILAAKEDKTDEAKAIWQEIIDRHEKGESDCEMLWEVYSNMVYYMIQHDADPNEIVAMADRGLEIRDDYSLLLMNKGYVLDEKLNKHEEGLECYRKVYELYPRHSTVCERMGGIYYFDLYDIPNALSCYEQQAQRSDSAFCQVMLGNCLSMLERFEESEQHFRTAIEMDGDYERAYKNYASMLMRWGHYDEALKMAQKSAEMAGDRSPWAKRLVAQALVRLGRYADASALHMELYEKFNRTDDLNSAADDLLDGGLSGQFLALIGKYKKELGDQYYKYMIRYSMATGDDRKWLRSIKCVSKDNADLPRDYAYYFYLHGDYKKALKYIEEFHTKNPESIMQRYIPIKCRKVLGRTDGIDELFEQGMKILSSDKNPTYKPLFLTKKAFLYITMGRFEEAKKCIDEAFASPLCDQCNYSGCIDGYDALSEYYEVLGDYNNAVLACLEGQKYSPLDCDFGVRLRRLRKEHKKELRKELQK